MRPRISLGTSDFQRLRREGVYYVDESLLVRDLLELRSEVVLLPRPRPFGKTLNLSTLQAFFERGDEDTAPLVADLPIWEAGTSC